MSESSTESIGCGKIGVPRSGPKDRFPTPRELGYTVDPESGRVLVDLSSIPEDNGIDADLEYAGPDEMLAILREREDFGPGDLNEVSEATLQRETKMQLSGSHGSGKKRAKPKPKPVSAIERIRSYEAERNLTRKSDRERAEEAIRENARRLEHKRSAGAPLKGKERRMVVAARMEPSKVIALDEATGGLSVAEILDSTTDFIQNHPELAAPYLAWLRGELERERSEDERAD